MLQLPGQGTNGANHRDDDGSCDGAQVARRSERVDDLSPRERVQPHQERVVEDEDEWLVEDLRGGMAFGGEEGKEGLFEGSEGLVPGSLVGEVS